MKNIFKIITLSRHLSRHLVALSLLVLVMSILQQAQPFFLKFIVDNIQLQITSGQGSASQVILLLAGMLVVNLFASILDSISQRYGDYISSRLRRYLTEVFYRHIFTLPQKYFDSEISGKILNQLNRGIQSIQDFLGMLTNFVLPALFQSIFTVAILLYYSHLIGLLALTIFPLYILISHYSTKKWGLQEVKKNKLEDISRGRIQEVIGNIRLVRGFLMQPKEWQLVSGILTKVNKIYDRQSTTYHILNFFREFGLEIFMVAIAFVVFKQTYLGVLSLGDMVLILQLLNMMRRPLFAMSFILERIQRAESGSKEFFEILELESAETFLIAKNKPPSLIKEPSLRFDHVSFTYAANETGVLHDLSFTLQPKQTIALVGHSGAGKTTIANLILKFYEPTSGEIYLNEKPFSQMSHQEVRQHLALVFQDTELFSTTVRENVAYGKVHAATHEIIKALKQANAYDFVKKLPQGLDSQIGERGVKLSGGQKQRLQIARAILHNAPILILDEATSSLDSRSENLIQEALTHLMQDKLVIIIAHRFSTIQSADQIIVIDKGKVADAGSPGELAQRPGIYQKLLNYQIQGNQKLLASYDLH